MGLRVGLLIGQALSRFGVQAGMMGIGKVWFNYVLSINVFM